MIAMVTGRVSGVALGDPEALDDGGIVAERAIPGELLRAGSSLQAASKPAMETVPTPRPIRPPLMRISRRLI
ncbi:MAG: hypothetical protein M3019_08400 [Candidatus Dormibacteraeota bacterium]|nr:hypothetical protein [Candidatus Dormibacteraeota bacterium]